MRSAIKVFGLTKYYGRLLAVDHIDFEVKKGEIFGFLGPNGAGKTTTVRMLTGVSRPTEGTAEVMGFNIQRNSIQAKELMGIVPDISNVYTDLSGWNNLIFTGRLYDIQKSQREKRAKELLAENEFLGDMLGIITAKPSSLRAIVNKAILYPWEEEPVVEDFNLLLNLF